MLNPEPVELHVMDRAVTRPWWRQRRLLPAGRRRRCRHQGRVTARSMT